MPGYFVHGSPAGEINKIDNAAVDGLEGVEDSLAYKVTEIETHFHSYESWFETASSPDGELRVADRIGEGAGAFQLDAGNNTWGNWVQILGANDTPTRAAGVKIDLHRLDVEATEVNDTYFIQIAFGASGAAALSAGEFTEAVFHANSNQVDAGPVMVQSTRQDTGTKIWARCMAPGNDTATIDFYFGLHEYPG